MPMTHDEIIESMMETIAECEQAMKASPSSKRAYELTLASSGMEIIEISEEALAAA